MSGIDGSPLIVLNALVIRADTTAGAGIRSSRSRYNVNRDGTGIEEPGCRDHTLAMTSQPQLEWEAFDEYWRKTHGPKIVHPEGPGDEITPLLIYYLQQHRLPGGPTSEYPPPYAAKTGGDGRIVPDPAARVVPHVRPPWDGLAQLAFRNRADLARFFDVGRAKYGDKIVPDEAVFLRGFGFHVAEEHVVLQNGDRRRDPIVMIATHTRNAGLDRAAFRRQWAGEHAALVRSLPQAKSVIRRYAQLHAISTPGDVLYDPVGDRLDGLGAMSFANMNDLEDFLASDAYGRVAAHLREFAADSSYFTTINYVIRDLTG